MKNFLLFLTFTLITVIMSILPHDNDNYLRILNWEDQGLVHYYRVD